MPCRSPQAQKRKYNKYAGKSILLQFSFNDHTRAETVHTVPTEKIVLDKLQKEYPEIPDGTFQSEVLNHVFGEVLNSPYGWGTLQQPQALEN